MSDLTYTDPRTAPLVVWVCVDGRGAGRAGGEIQYRRVSEQGKNEEYRKLRRRPDIDFQSAT